MNEPPTGRRLWLSVRAVSAGFLVVTVMSLAADQVFHLLGVYPPWGAPMWDAKLNALALSYRLPIDVFGSFLTARLAPDAPMRHVWIGAAVVLVVTALGGIGAIMSGLGPPWFPILLMLSSIPTAWIGGTIHLRRARP